MAATPSTPPTELRTNLGLQPGQQLPGGFTVKEVQVSVEVQKPRLLYNFPVRCVLNAPASKSTGLPEDDHDDPDMTVKNNNREASNDDTSVKMDVAEEGAVSALQEAVRTRSIMYSAYGWPYEVHLENVRAKTTPDGEAVEVRAMGVAQRRRDLPRLSPPQTPRGSTTHTSAATGGNGNGDVDMFRLPSDEEQADDEVKRLGYRVSEAHFSSSRCSMCDERFTTGQHIARNVDDDPANDNGRGGWAHVTCIADGRNIAALKAA